MTAWITWTPVVPDAQGSRQPQTQEIRQDKNSFLASGTSAPVRTEHGGGTAAYCLDCGGPQQHQLGREASCSGHRRYGTIRIPF